MLSAPVDDGLLDLVASELPRVLQETDHSLIACLITETATNTFPALPIREGVNALVWLTRHQGARRERSKGVGIVGPPPGTDGLADAHGERQVEPVETLDLWPTPRSALRGEPFA